MAEVISSQHGNAVVLRGSFNPRILLPPWLAAQGLIREAESENATIQIVHEQVVAFGLGWVSIDARHDQLTIQSSPTSETPEQIRDLALGILGILEHTPIYGVGLQFFGHYELADQAARDSFGSSLVPSGPFEAHLGEVVMRSLTVSGRRREGEGEDEGVSITVEPSAVIAPSGIYIGVFDQYDVADPDDAYVNSAGGIGAIESYWEESSRRAQAIIEDVFATT